MTETMAATILSSVPPTLAALAGVFVSVRNSLKADTIRSMVDGNLSKVQEDLATARKEITELRELIQILSLTKEKGPK